MAYQITLQLKQPLKKIYRIWILCADVNTFVKIVFMKKIHSFLFSTVLFTVAATGSSRAQNLLTPGRLVVLQAGDSAIALSNKGNAVFLKEYLKNAAAQPAPTATITIPTTGSKRLVISGTAATEGSISLSADSTNIVIPGYDASTTNTVALPGSGSSAINRVVDTVGLSGVAGRAAATATALSATNIRSAVKGSGNDYWAVGGTGGVQYLGNSGAAVGLGTSVTNIRALRIMNGNLYFSSTTGTLPGITKVAGMPMVSGTGVGALLFSTGVNSQPGDFAINAGETIAYVADGRAAAGGGIQKWVLNTGTWTCMDTLNVGGGARGLAVDWSSAFPKLFATTSDNRLVAVIDSNYATGYVNSYVTIATAPANTAFRGVAFTPKPAAPCTAPTLSATVTPAGCTSGGSITLTATGGSPVNSYSWTGPGSFTAATQNLSNLSAGSYAVTATTAGGCTATTTATVTSTAGVTAIATAAGATTFCQGGSVVLNANTGAGYSYQWYNGTTAITGATSASFTTNTTGSYTVQITSGSCTATSAPVAVTVTPPVNATISAAGPVAFCPGDSVLLRTTNANGLTYQWHHNGTPLPGATDSVWAARLGGNYRVVVSNGSCADTSAPFTVTVHPRTIAIISAATDTSFCLGDSVLLKSNTGAGLTFQWAMNGAFIPGATSGSHMARISGNYRVIVTNSNGCADTSRAIHVTAKPLPTPIAAYTGGQLTVQNAPMYTNFRWYLNGGATPVATSVPFTPTSNGNYTLRADSNGCTGISNTVVVSGLAVSTVLQNAFSVYPNPATTAFEILPVGKYQVRIADVQGRTVLQTQTVSGVDISGISNGLYLLFIREAGAATETPVRLLKR